MTSYRKNRPIFLLFMLVIFMAACDSNVFFDESHKISNEAWNQGQSEEFKIEISDTLAFYDFYLNIRHTTDYSYSNLYFFINSGFPDGNTSRDTIECVLADKNGKWFGKGIGKIKDNRILIKRNVRFPDPGIYMFSFEQAMREPVLEGLTDIGIRLEESSR